MSGAPVCAGGGFFGARFSLYPMTDRFVPVILHAIEGLRETGLDVETDDVSTFLGGDVPAVFEALERTFARAASSGEHVVMTVLFSHGCPGESTPDETVIGNAAVIQTGPEDRKVRVACQWSLYPLEVQNHMQVIYREIGRTKEAGVFTRGQHFVSRLDGELSAVLGAIRASVESASANGDHIVAHATIAANSPSLRKGEGKR